MPEGRLRELIASRDRIDPRDTWALLVRHGQDTAGALSLVPDDLPQSSLQERLVPLSREALQLKIQESRKRNLPLMASWDEIRMSLAGAQEKLGLRTLEEVLASRDLDPAVIERFGAMSPSGNHLRSGHYGPWNDLQSPD